jgi:hypothetical protein
MDLNSSSKDIDLKQSKALLKESLKYLPHSLKNKVSIFLDLPVEKKEKSSICQMGPFLFK